MIPRPACRSASKGPWRCSPDVKTTMSDFEFNVDMDESLFSVEPPAGYEVHQGPHD